MFDNIENLKIVYTIYRAKKPYAKIENRKTNSFLINVRGSMLFDFYDKNILVNEGEIIFIPKGSSYISKALCEGSMCTVINFEGDFTKELQPTRYSLENFYEADYISKCFSDMWNFGTQAEKYQCISLFYSLLSHLSTIENASCSEKSKFKIIDPAVAYLKEHIYDCTLKIDKLHHLCGISHTYFRQIFTLRFGTTPQNYIISKRISHAKAIISSGDFNSIGEVALSIGFNDPLYFSKVFKKKYGISPSDINQD